MAKQPRKKATDGHAVINRPSHTNASKTCQQLQTSPTSTTHFYGLPQATISDNHKTSESEATRTQHHNTSKTSAPHLSYSSGNGQSHHKRKKTRLQREIWAARHNLTVARHQRKLDQLLTQNKLPMRRNKHLATKLDDVTDQDSWTYIITNHFRAQHQHDHPAYTAYHGCMDKDLASLDMVADNHNMDHNASNANATANTTTTNHSHRLLHTTTAD